MTKDIEIASYGNLLVYKKGYIPSQIHSLLMEHKLNGLRIFDHLDPLDNLDFLKECGFLERLDIDCINDLDYSFLRQLTELRQLHIGTSVRKNNIIDLSFLQKLEDLNIEWRKNIKGIEHCPRLQHIGLVDFKQDDFSFVKGLKNLRDVGVASASIKSLAGLESLDELQHLVIGNCQKLQSVRALNGLKKLQSIKFEACTKIKDYGHLTNLPALEILQITDGKGIESIKFVENIPSLTKLYLLGNTNVLDGDLTPAKNIKDVVCRNRRHYNIRIENKEQDARRKQNLERLRS